MKKFLVCVSLVTSLVGCAQPSPAPQPEAVNPSGLAVRLVGEEGLETLSQVPVDLDIASFSQTMAYGQVNAMMYEPDPYLGQSVKLRGIYDSYTMRTTEETYHYIMLLDETACCQGTLDILLPEGYDYPPTGSEILVMGDFTLQTFSFGDYPVIRVSSYVLVDPNPQIPSITNAPDAPVGPVAVGPLA